jgi:hypothetical protein
VTFYLAAWRPFLAVPGSNSLEKATDVFLSQACHSFAKDFVSMVSVHRHIEFSGLYYKRVTIVIGAPSVVSK